MDFQIVDYQNYNFDTKLNEIKFSNSNSIKLNRVIFDIQNTL